MNNRALWKLMQESISAIYPHYQPVVERYATQAGWDATVWILLLGALTPEPQTLSASRYQARNPYSAANGYVTRLAPAVEKGYLEEVEDGELHLTETGRSETQRFIDEVRKAMAAADPLQRAPAGQLTALLRRLMGMSLATPPPPSTLSIRFSLKLLPAQDPPLPYIEQAISCLAAYRDDAHLAAWQPSGLSATALESLTLLWRGEVGSLDTLVDKLARRGHPRQVYAQSLDELRAREFVSGPDEAPSVTAAGRKFRDEVESSTDRYFFGPWASLTEGDRAALRDLLSRLRDGLQANQPA